MCNPVHVEVLSIHAFWQSVNCLKEFVVEHKVVIVWILCKYVYDFNLPGNLTIQVQYIHAYQRLKLNEKSTLFKIEKIIQKYTLFFLQWRN